MQESLLGTFRGNREIIYYPWKPKLFNTPSGIGILRSIFRFSGNIRRFLTFFLLLKYCSLTDSFRSLERLWYSLPDSLLQNSYRPIFSLIFIIIPTYLLHSLESSPFCPRNNIIKIENRKWLGKIKSAITYYTMQFYCQFTLWATSAERLFLEKPDIT